MTPLKITDIREWLIENRREYQKLKTQEFPPFDNPLYWTYEHLYDFIQYYTYKQQCGKALSELNTDDVTKLSSGQSIMNF